ncbi:hypothetical protein ACEPPN_010209 [Leptodophora sp. 'Broadleaf-Isolate-01']
MEAVSQSQPEVVSTDTQGTTRLVIALDYGTTHTGVAWATPTGARASLAPGGIEVVQIWGAKMGNHKKIPSVVSYTPSSRKGERQFGLDLSADAVALLHTKLQLGVSDVSQELDHILESLEGVHNLNFQYLKKSDGLPKHILFSPEQIVRDYLQRVFHYLFESESDSLPSPFAPELRQLTPVDIVVTVPAAWKYRAKNATFRALTQAGFNNDEDKFPRLGNIMLVTEPEAAAVYTARYLKEKLGSRFRMRDCVSYKVKQLDPFEIERVGLPVGAKCGAIFINLAFKKWLRSLIGAERYHQLDPTKLSDKITSHDAEGEVMRKLMSDFEAWKKAFKGAESRQMYIDLPESFHDLRVDDRVRECQVTISSQDMASFFEHSRRGIWRLIQNQLDDIRAKGTRPRNVFLVGGFAESPYLQAAIRRSLEAIPELPKVELRTPDPKEPGASWTAVVQGAVIFGIEKATIGSIPTMRASPRSYGFMVSKLFSRVEHDPREVRPDKALDIELVQEQLQWMIMKGDLILSNQLTEAYFPFERNLTEAGSKTGSVAIFSYDYEDKPPTNYAKFKNEPGLSQIHALDYDLTPYPIQTHRRSSKNHDVHIASLILKIRIIPGALHLQICLEGRERAISSVTIYDPLLDDIVCPPLEEEPRDFGV